MLDKIKTYLKKGNQYYGLEVYEASDDIAYRLVTITRQKGELHIESSISSNKIDEIAKEIKKQYPVLLIVNTSEIITKIQSKVTSSSLDEIVLSALPNIDVSAFYYEVINQKQNHVVAVCRKEVVDDIINSLKTKNIFVTGFSLGITCIESLLPHIDEEAIVLNSQQVQLSENSIAQLSPVEENTTKDYIVNGTNIASTDLLAFSTVLNFAVGKTVTAVNHVEKQQKLVKEFLEKRFFFLFIRGALIFLLTVLLINFFAFNFYYQENQKLQEATQIHDTQRKQLNKITDRLELKRNRVDKILNSATSKSAWFLDKIAENLPESILLESLLYQPLLKNVRVKQPVEIQHNTIVAKGVSSNDNGFSKWVQDLEKESWINSVAIKEYDYTNGSQYGFSLEIIIRQSNE